MGELLCHLQQQDLLHSIEFGPLNCDESATLAASVAGSALDSALQTRLFTATEGQPLNFFHVNQNIRPG